MSPTHYSTPFDWLKHLGLALVFVLAVLAAITLSAVFFAIFSVLALILGVWLWWQSRHLRRQLREQEEAILEVEYEVVDEHLTHKKIEPQDKQPLR